MVDSYIDLYARVLAGAMPPRHDARAVAAATGDLKSVVA